MSRLTAENIVKTYGNKDVLHNVNLELEEGKIYGCKLVYRIKQCM